jgi:CubicO group peptidase (beta-lactamase class C family)
LIKQMKFAPVMILVSAALPFTVAAEMIFPGAEWEEVTPAKAGLDPTKLQEAVRYLEARTGRDGARELVMVRNGRIVWRGDNIDHVHGVWSCTKSFTSTMLGLLIEDGKCTLETKAASVVPEMQEYYPAVRLRHFTTMTSGYRADGDTTSGSYTHGPSSTPFVPAREPLFAPGAAYAYWDSAMNQFAHVLTVIAGQPLEQLFKRRLADPMQMNPAAWKWGDFGTVNGIRLNGGSGNSGKHIQISARELARFGHLFLNHGRWNSRQLISSNWIREATSVQVMANVTNAWPRSGIAGPGFYGFNWWRNGKGPDGKMLWPGAPEDTFGASGHNNNKLFLIPSWGIVIVRLGLDQADRKWTEDAQGEFLRLVGSAIQNPESSARRGAALARPADLALQTSLPDPLVMLDGRRVTTRTMWFEEWLHPETGRYFQKGRIAVSEGNRNFVPPELPNDDWVLHLVKIQ